MNLYNGILYKSKKVVYIEWAIDWFPEYTVNWKYSKAETICIV